MSELIISSDHKVIKGVFGIEKTCLSGFVLRLVRATFGLPLNLTQGLLKSVWIFRVQRESVDS